MDRLKHKHFLLYSNKMKKKNTIKDTKKEKNEMKNQTMSKQLYSQKCYHNHNNLIEY